MYLITAFTSGQNLIVTMVLVDHHAITFMNLSVFMMIKSCNLVIDKPLVFLASPFFVSGHVVV